MSVVLRPRMSEKTYALSEDGVFVFLVDNGLNKHQIAEAVASTYEVDVVNVNIVNQKGKEKRIYRNRRFYNGKRSDTKKAYVTLKEGQSIPIFAAVEEAEEKAEKAQAKADKKSEKTASEQPKGALGALRRRTSRKSAGASAAKVVKQENRGDK